MSIAEARGAPPLGGRIPIERVETLVYEIPTDGPEGTESDGTLEWGSTTLVVAVVHGGGTAGLGYTYGPSACAALIEETLAQVALAADPLAVAACWRSMTAAIRNAGRPGIGAMAVSALDVALWDLKARMLEAPLVDVLDRARDAAPIYGSGGFCNYSLDRLADQLAGWVGQGIPRVKMKIGRRPDEDPARLDAARAAVGADTELYADANGAYSRAQAVAWAHRLRERWGVAWFEEPVSSDDAAGLRYVRDRSPSGIEVAAGEYVYLLRDAETLLAAGSVDCLQLDVTRCGGITGLLRAASAADARSVEVSGHCAPQASAHVLCAVPRVRHLEYFHDHVRVERMAFDGVLEPVGGTLRPDRSRPGLGLSLRRDDLEQHCVHRGVVER